MKTIFILVDALKSPYMSEDNMPFLHQLAQENFYIRRIKQGPGFCERSEVFTGLTPAQSGLFTAIGYMPKMSNYQSDDMKLRAIQWIKQISSRAGNYLARKYQSHHDKEMKMYNIPAVELPCFALTEDGGHEEFATRSIFSSLDDAGKSYDMHGFTSLANDFERTNFSILEFVEKGILKSIDFLPVYISTIDTYGHYYGDDIQSMRKYLADVDELIKRIYILTKENGYAIAVLGDHGMVPVRETVNIYEKSKKWKIKLNKDYDMFLDSTVARFWTYSNTTEKFIKTELEKHFGKNGMIIDEKNCKKYGIPLWRKNSDDIPIYGNFLWYANYGCVISPDYFHTRKERIKGMHGFLSVETEDAYGTFVASLNEKSTVYMDDARLCDICGILCDMLEISAPNM